MYKSVRESVWVYECMNGEWMSVSVCEWESVGVWVSVWEWRCVYKSVSERAVDLEIEGCSVKFEGYFKIQGVFWNLVLYFEIWRGILKFGGIFWNWGGVFQNSGNFSKSWNLFWNLGYILKLMSAIDNSKVYCETFRDVV